MRRILDHGGHAVAYVPFEILEHYRVVGIEKTSSGLFDRDKKGLPLFPIIDVANCLAKRHLESPLIAKAVVNKLFTHLPAIGNNRHYGVVGLGAVGNAITDRLVAMGQKLIIHDVNFELTSQYTKHAQVVCANDISSLIAASDLIFGCSGRDITETTLEQFLLSARDKTLVSCSSEDKEFLSLLRFVDSQRPTIYDPLDTIEYQSKLGASIRLLRGGFPANFDNSGESVPANEIQLTRALVVGAVLQAIEFFDDFGVLSKPNIYALNMDVQRFIVSEWLKNNSTSKNIEDLFTRP